MKPGVYQMPMAEYQADPCPVPSMSSGIANLIVTRSPYHAYCAHPRLGNQPQEDSGQLDYGAACHAVLLEGEDALAVCDYEDWRKKDAQAERVTARLQGKIPVLTHQRARIDAMVKAALTAIDNCQDLDPADWHGGASEQTLIWQEDGIWCRARPDRMSADRRVLFDYKTTGNAHPDAFTRLIFSMGYDLQAAHYLTGNAATGGPEDATWLWLVQENEAPYACSFIGMAPALREHATTKRFWAAQAWRECMETGAWSAYPNKICYAEPPAWALSQWDERALRETIGALA